MRSVCAILALMLFLLVALLAPRARAEAPSARTTPVHVLSIDSDDAEDQADALSGALRWTVRRAPGWSLQETAHSLSMLTAALRCPPRPDPACLQRIGDQIHTDRFVWGVMSKAPGNQVTAEIHLWTRGKPDSMVKETFSDNLKDQNDEALRRIAQRIFDRITGALSSGTIVVRAGDGSGQVLVDGQRRAALEHGAATLELPIGAHVVEVRAPGYAPAKQSVNVVAGAEQSVTLRLAPEAAAEAPATPPAAGMSTRRIVAWSAIGVGAALSVVAGIEGIRFLGLKDDLNADRKNVDRSIVDVCAPDAASNPYAVDACNKFHDARTARTLGFVLGGVGAALAITGVVLLATDHPHEQAAPTEARRITVTPYGSPFGAGADLRMTF